MKKEDSSNIGTLYHFDGYRRDLSDKESPGIPTGE